MKLAAAAALALAVSFWTARAHVSAQAPAQQGLEVTSSVTYDASAEHGPVRVTWQVDVSNFDASTGYSSGGYVYYYTSLGVPVLRGATALSAFGPGGGSLYVSTQELDEGPVIAAQVSFDRGVFYGESYHFSLSYEVTGARSAMLMVSPSYVFFPAVGAGIGSSTVSVQTPAASGWDVSLESVDCSEVHPASYQCSAVENTPLAALVEVSRPADIQTLSAPIDVSGRHAAATIRYFAGEESWAAHTKDLVSTALPVLEEIYGVPYPGPLAFDVAERGRESLGGYEGLFTCSRLPECEVGLSPVGDDATTIHELAHFWTDVFSSRWLGEGWAEFAAQQAIPRLGSLVAYSPRPAAPDMVPLSLDTWGAATYLLTMTQEQKTKEYSGYERSRQFIEQLEQTVGLPALQAVNVEIADEEDRSVNSRRYFDVLEEASGKQLDQLFLESVFLPSQAPVLEERRTARDRFDTFSDDVDAAGLSTPERIERAIRLWEFDKANELMDQATPAVRSYDEALEEVDQRRNVWERFGLLGKDPDGGLDDAAVSFAAGEFDKAAEQADSARELVDGASRAAFLRLLMVLGVWALFVAAGFGVWIAVRRRRRRRFLA